MVNKLQDNFEYIKYIRKEMNETLSNWKEINVVYEGEPNNNFGIVFKMDFNKIQFIKDRGLLNLEIYYNEEPIRLGYLVYNLIPDYIPEQDLKWRLTICTELIDYYHCCPTNII